MFLFFFLIINKKQGAEGIKGRESRWRLAMGARASTGSRIEYPLKKSSGGLLSDIFLFLFFLKK